MDEGEEEKPLIQLPDKVKIFNKPQFVGQRTQALTVHGGLIIALDLARSLTCRGVAGAEILWPFLTRRLVGMMVQ
jgi:hypothetical protein